nr:radical SAM protein [bacterium]
HRVQWKNLNIDPDVYVRCLGLERLSRSQGMRSAVETIRHRLPQVRFGYFNPPREQFEEDFKKHCMK